MVERIASSGIAGSKVINIKDSSNSLHSYNSGSDIVVNSILSIYL